MLEILSAEESLDINTEPPILEEVKEAIGAMKSGKAAGVDQVTADMLKEEERDTTAADQALQRHMGEGVTTRRLEDWTDSEVGKERRPLRL